MASTSDRATGLFFLLVAITVFTYYTTWVMLLPFLSSDHFLHAFFLPRPYAVTVPVMLLVVGVSGILAFLGKVMISQARKKKKKAA